MKVLITGGCGYIGSYLIPYLNKMHNDAITELIIYDNLSLGDSNLLFRNPLSETKVRFIKGDILDQRTLLKALDGVEVVVHLAAKITQPYTDVHLHIFDQVNNWGTSCLADAIEQSNVKKVIYLSSIVIYGTSDTDITEEVTPEPITYYGLSKLKGERHIQRIPKVDTYILRSANVYGNSNAMRIDSVINRFMFEGHFFNTVNKVSNGEQSRAFIHIHKLAQIIAGIIIKAVPAGVYNVAEHNFSINNVLEEVMKIYPELDVITVDQDAKLEHINMSLPIKLSEHVNWTAKEFSEELKEMHKAFSF